MGEFEDKVVLITGAGRGIGRAIAESFADVGAIVAANDITPINLDETLARITESGGRARAYVADIAKKMPVQTMVEAVLDDWGRIDILINNAGVQPRVPLLDLDEWDWRRTLDVNLTGAFFTIQSVGRVMRAQGGGVMVNIGSITGIAYGFRGRSAYAASKMGLIGLTREAARELAEYNIRVNAVCPGVIETEKTTELQQDESMMSECLVGIPQGRLGKPEDVASVVILLSSESTAYLTGQAINVDGGMVMC
jgi:NAD(P)-dependent dehydrogenase (short-subunit alcohol dehydrogenase family)